MSLGLVGRKVGMTRVFTDDGISIPVTVLEVVPNRVIQIKTNETDGYQAIQVAHGSVKASKLNKAKTGHYAKAAKEAGVKAVKLQTIDPDKSYAYDTESYRLFSMTKLTKTETKKIFELSKNLGLEIFTTVGDIETANKFNKFLSSSDKLKEIIIHLLGEHKSNMLQEKIGTVSSFFKETF